MMLSKTYQQMTKQVMRITVLLLVILLSSCASKPVTTVQPQIPAVLISYLDKTNFNGRTYGDVAQYAVILKRERDICLNRIDRIREWQVQHAQK